MPEADHTHIDAAEAAEADDPAIGDGTPETAPLVPADHLSAPSPSLTPTRKWIAAQTTLLAGLLTLFAAHGWHFDEHTTIATITFLAEAVVAYLVPNTDDPGGVPTR